MISIVIPTYNEEKEIAATIKQFSSLDIPHEIIVSDTASTDGTIAAAKATGATILLSPAGVRKGVAAARNRGGNAARGEFIVFLDSSTIIPDPNSFFQKILAAFANDPKLLAISTRVRVEPALRQSGDEPVCWINDSFFWVMNNIFGVGMAAGKFQMVRASAFHEVHGFNENLFAAEDLDFFGRLAKIGRTRIIWSLSVFHSGRRFHQLGAWRTMFRWIKNTISVWLFKKPADKAWETVR